jgi:hypothetical protein
MRMPRPTYGGVIATVALFVALGGTSYAALTITGKNIKNGTVTGSDLKNESVTGRDIDNGSLSGSDVRAGSLTSSDLADGTLTAADFKAGELPAGARGLTGPPGPGAFADAVVRTTDVPLPPDSRVTDAATCNPNEIALGGGAGYGSSDDQISILYDEPVESDGSIPEDGDVANGWRATGNNVHSAASGISATMTVFVVCVEQ